MRLQQYSIGGGILQSNKFFQMFNEEIKPQGEPSRTNPYSIFDKVLARLQVLALKAFKSFSDNFTLSFIYFPNNFFNYYYCLLFFSVIRQQFHLLIRSDQIELINNGAYLQCPWIKLFDSFSEIVPFLDGEKLLPVFFLQLTSLLNNHLLQAILILVVICAPIKVLEEGLRKEILLLEEVELLLQLRVFGALDGIVGDEVAEMNVKNYGNGLADAKAARKEELTLISIVQHFKHI